MHEASQSPSTKPEAYRAYKNGDISEEHAREILGDDWEKSLQLGRVEGILNQQPEPDIQDEDLFR
ncbi:hypothetical protein [Halobacterium salinarum]|uniref:hypothetical protein n=1 Tax=Halobacterium salinarum TaxID=2242 RepID=UPI0025541997|nr:hypothetical protein [Halobacterium salinarum]MDL0134579.1 hypothetical protein [Halobacterium salinarum]